MPISGATGSSNGSRGKEHGKSGGFRVIVAFDANTRAVFLLAFAKNDRDNITTEELESLKTIAALWLEADEKSIERSMKERELAEVKDDEAEK
ncbi:MAG TPA: type II toxin-antitoxin system RelE/ParE family toxin [Rhizomicrobium sp.]|jgi:hypothetical protein